MRNKDILAIKAACNNLNKNKDKEKEKDKEKDKILENYENIKEE